MRAEFARTLLLVAMSAPAPSELNADAFAELQTKTWRAAEKMLRREYSEERALAAQLGLEQLADLGGEG